MIARSAGSTPRLSCSTPPSEYHSVVYPIAGCEPEFSASESACGACLPLPPGWPGTTGLSSQFDSASALEKPAAHLQQTLSSVICFHRKNEPERYRFLCWDCRSEFSPAICRAE